MCSSAWLSVNVSTRGINVQSLVAFDTSAPQQTNRQPRPRSKVKAGETEAQLETNTINVSRNEIRCTACVRKLLSQALARQENAPKLGFPQWAGIDGFLSPTTKRHTKLTIL